MEAPESVTSTVNTAPTPTPPPVVETSSKPSVTPQMETGGFMESISKPKMKFVDIFIAGLLIATQIYVIVDTRRRIKKEEEMPTREEFDNFVDDLNEVKYNVQKQLGRKYIKT